MRAEEISALAKEQGMSYGQYVFLHRKELKGNGRTAQMRRCLWCGRSILGTHSNRRFCSDFCRRMDWHERRGDLR